MLKRIFHYLRSRQSLRRLVHDENEHTRLQLNRLAAQSDQLVLQLANLANHFQQSLSIVDNSVRSTDAMVRNSIEAGLPASQLAQFNPRLRRNFLPNDSALAQKHLMLSWNADSDKLTYEKLLSSAFRVFSQNDEDGIILRIFSKIGVTNRYVIEIGSNCSDSDVGLPENLSANLIVNHGWHGAVFELDERECARMRHFFARDFATKHFHVEGAAGFDGYFSPVIVNGAVTGETLETTLRDVCDESEPDLFILDIDGGDFAIARAMTSVRPRVIVIEFEKRFRDRHSVVQSDRNDFSKRWAQSGAASLTAWMSLLGAKGYVLVGIGGCGFNAFFMRSDLAATHAVALSADDAFGRHPILSKVSESFWLEPDESWQVM